MTLSRLAAKYATLAAPTLVPDPSLNADGSGSNFVSQDFFQNVSSIRNECGVIWIFKKESENRMAELLDSQFVYSLRSEIRKKIF
jgi:hypothetical protein